MKWSLFLLLIIYACFFEACKDKSAEVQEIEPFDEFNQRFHSDPEFQLSRIRFPLSGGRYGPYESTEWTEGNWEFLPAPVGASFDSALYKPSLVKTDTSIREHYWNDKNGFSRDREFRRIEGRWFLVYYHDAQNHR